MAKANKPTANAKKKPIEQYAHKDKQRVNNPNSLMAKLALGIVFPHLMMKNRRFDT